MAILQLLDLPGSPATIVVTTIVLWLVLVAVYRLFFHPISHIPGPFLARVTSLWIYRHTYIGDEPSTLLELHRKYGPVVRVSPNEVDIADGDALNIIYVAHGGYLKAPCYTKFDIEGYISIFSAIDPNHRLPRAKAVFGLFSTGSIRAGADRIEACVDGFIERLRRDVKAGTPVNVLNLTRSFALDSVSAYLFKKPYDGIAETSLSASGFVDTFVGVGRFFYLPTWLFLVLEKVETWLDRQSAEVEKSMARVDDYVSQIVEEASPEDETYQGRLKHLGISDHENRIQCKDLIFAGTDSTGLNLATVMWHLAKNPSIYARLREAVTATAPSTDPQTIPFLRGVINEGLRLSMTTPSRFPRVVPPGAGLTVPSPTSSSIRIPPGTIVSAAPYVLYLNSSVYSSPESFDPDRWTKASAEMSRDFIPFGLGSRQCIARNLATAELFFAVDRLVRTDALKGAMVLAGDKGIEIVGWFNGRVKGGRIELVWDKD